MGTPETKRVGLEAFAEVQRLIVVAAHPDDLECICGGTVAMLAERGVEIFSVNCTLGDIGTREAGILRPALAATRLAEAEEAARLLGIRRVYNLGHHDGELVASLELRAQIARLYRLTQADTLLTFDPYWPGQIHPDHRAAGQAALDAYMPSKMPLYRPEQLAENGADLCRLTRVFLFSTQREPDVFVDVSAVYERKVAACLAHRSQFPEGEKNLDWMKEMDARAGEEIQVPYAEVFKTMPVW
ncbi:PIG-L family deacetylase [Litorilinea aerophila]|uniref:PIG-L family deacetylase n=1 Tax=Litorilinea aerophila TaxID=1204385 RepID=A0A540VI06_9CHLR|nr:PIG-L deacetylase family protein [Litorilinea aerophila]MCC9076044.1 PIG-L family deacetylase [Litorilinea aerophila]